MPVRKNLVAFLFAFVVFSAIYAFVTLRMGTSPGPFFPSAFLFISWFIGQILAESLYVKDPLKWKRSAATVAGAVAMFCGVGFLVVIEHQFSPVVLVERSALDAVAGFAAVMIGMALPRFRRTSR